MPLNILLADDSVPAQNMGKKILMDAGYGVVTVSNGLEALRKIGDAVPDMAILDIFMPGYTGLEICKRLRSSAATAAVPVILTVGKLEPYRPEDGEQVQSNAVIVKPFAANELISAVRSLIGGPLAESQPGAAVEAGLQSNPQPAPMVEGDTPPRVEPTAEETELLNPLAAHHAATAEPPAEVFQEEELDEPIFAIAESGIGGDAEPFNAQGTAQASSIYGGESLLAGADPNGDASLAFDPDAKSTPFSASVIDSSATSSESQAAAGNGASGCGEFDLETESSAYSAPESVTSGVEVGTAGPQSPTAPEPIASASEGMVELESSDSEFTALDPLLEAPEALGSSGVSGAGILDAPEQSFSEFTTAGAEEADSAFNAVQLSPEEEARREAFEALFNSPEPLPLDQVAVPQPETTPAALASSTDALLEDATDFAIPSATPFATHIESHYEPQVSDPNPLEEAQIESETESAPPSALEAIPEPRPELLDEALAPAEWPQAIANAGDQSAGISTAPSPEAATTEAAPAAVQQVCTEVDPEPSAAYEPAPSAEILQTVPEPAQEASQAGDEDFQYEAVPHETGTVPSEAAQSESRQPAPETATEIFVSALDSPLDDARSDVRQPQIPQQLPVSQPVDVAPLVSVPAVEEQLEPAPIDSEPEQQPEPSMTAISSSPGVSSRLNEAERIHHAIELVFDRFKPLLVAAIVRELARND